MAGWNVDSLRGGRRERSIRGVRRYPVLLATLVVLILAAAPRLRALTDEEKKEQFLEAQGDADSSPGVTPHHKKKHVEAEATPHHRHSPTPEPDVTPKHRHESDEAAGDVTPAHREVPSPAAEARTPFPTQTVIRASAAVTPAAPRALPAPTPPPGATGAQVNIEKEGLEQQGGLVPPEPTPTPHRHWWQFFGGGEDETQYHYLTKEVREAIDRAPVARNRWRYIVVHNSGTRQGNAKIFDYYHRYVRKMPNGLAYQFVIGNGSSSGNGQIEVGNRWVRQIQGGHVHSDYLNNIALGICLVGDFNRDQPTKEQKEALVELIRYLRKRVGKVDGHPSIVKAHREINPPQWPTDCPGDKFPYDWLHSTFN
jgi:hypothetical protein